MQVGAYDDHKNPQKTFGLEISHYRALYHRSISSSSLRSIKQHYFTASPQQHFFHPSGMLVLQADRQGIR